ncbi:MAG TPA: flagellar brake protein [Fimbriimonadaceae bacterium]|nr:flagellar brake protein [Fimbriimonadaceae bacterium]
MENLVSLLVFFATGFAVAVAAAWLFVKVALHFRQKLIPPVGSILRIRATSGSYRSTLMKLGGSVWTISAPLQRDSYVPLRVGEEVVIEAASSRGALLFRSTIVARHTQPHSFTIRRPEKIHQVERREHKRWPHLAGESVKLEGQNGRIIDLSEGGARIQSAYRTHKGDRVRLDLPWGEAIYGWVLSAEGNETRMRFEDLMELRPAKRETAPAV